MDPTQALPPSSQHAASEPPAQKRKANEQIEALLQETLSSNSQEAAIKLMRTMQISQLDVQETKSYLTVLKKAKLVTEENYWQQLLLSCLSNNDQTGLSECFKQIKDLSFLYQKFDTMQLSREELDIFLNAYFTIDPKHLHVNETAEMPAVDLSQLHAMFDAIDLSDVQGTNYLSPESLGNRGYPPQAPQLTTQDLARGFHRLVDQLTSSQPRDTFTQELVQVYQKTTQGLLKLAPENRGSYVIGLAIGSLLGKARCLAEGNRLNQLFSMMSQTDDKVTSSVLVEQLKAMREGIVVEMSGADTHLYHHIQIVLGEALNIPHAKFHDPFAPKQTAEQLMYDFETRYTPSLIFHFLQATVKEMIAGDAKRQGLKEQLSLLISCHILKVKLSSQGNLSC